MTEESTGKEPEVKNLSDLVSYQQSSVVSREIIRKKGGTVTVFAFDVGQGLSEHIAPFDALVQVLDGSAEITISGKPYSLQAGEMIILPPGQVHSVRAISRFKMMLVMVRA